MKPLIATVYLNVGIKVSYSVFVSNFDAGDFTSNKKYKEVRLGRLECVG